MAEQLLAGVRLPANWVSVVGALEGLLAAAGKGPLSPDPELPEGTYLMGVTGHAFHLAMDMMATPEGPSQFNFHQIFPQWERLQAWFHRAGAYPSQEDPAPAREEAWRRIVQSIDRGWPAICYDFGDQVEYGLITGYREEGGRRQLRGLQHAVGEVDWFDLDQLPHPDHPWSRLDVITLVAVEPGFDHDSAELASIRFAVDHAWWPASRDQWVSYGLKAYDVWAGSLMMPSQPPEARPSHAYCAQVARAARQAAAVYLRSLASRRTGDLAQRLAAAADGYGEVAAQLDQLCGLMPWPEGADLGEPATRKAIIDGLRLARRKEEGALSHLERALRAW